MKKGALIVLIFASYLGLTTKNSGADFNVYYTTAQNFIRNKNIFYSNLENFETAEFNYAPPSLLLFLPLAYFSNEMAKLIWHWLNIFFIFCGIYFLWKTIDKDNLLLLFVFLFLTVIFYPIKFALILGQSSILIFFIYALSFYLIQKKDNHTAGFLLSIAVILKIFPAIFLIFAIITKQKKLFFVMFVAIILWFIISFTIFGKQTNLNFFRHIWYIWYYTKWDNYPNWISMSAFFNRTFGISILNYLTIIILFIISVLSVLKNQQNQKTFFVSILLSILLCKFSQLHWLMWTLIPLFFLVGKFIHEKKWLKLTCLILLYFIINTSDTSFTVCIVRNLIPQINIILHFLPIIGTLILWLILIIPENFKPKKYICIFMFIISCNLYARQGTLVLKNGNVVKGNIVAGETGNYIVETKKWSMLFSKEEVKSVKYTGQEKLDNSSGKFVQKMKNTKKQEPKNPRTQELKNYDYDPLIYLYADKYNLDPAFVKAVIEAESNFNPNDVSCKGAIGLMQLMPQTAKGLKVNPEDTEQNIEGGIRYLNYMLEKFNNSLLALAAYNAGPNAVKKYGKKVPPYRETQNYIENVLKNYQKHKSDKQMWYFVDDKGCIYISDSPKDKRYKRIEK